MAGISVFFLQFLNDVPWRNDHRSSKRRDPDLGSLKSGHFFANGTRNRVVPGGRRRQFTSLLNTVRGRYIAMSLLAQGLKLRLRTLEALTQAGGSIRLLSKSGV